MRRDTIQPARVQTFTVLWYEVRHARAVINPGSETRAFPPTAKKRVTFMVEARTLDAARELARDHVRHRGVEVLSVNFTQRRNELIIYSKEAP